MKTYGCSFFLVVLGCTLFAVRGESAPTPIHTSSPSSPADVQIYAADSATKIAKKKSKRPQVALQINLIYAHIRQKAFMDPKLKQDLPILHSMYDFNSYQLLNQFRYRLDYQQAIIIPISYVFQVQVSPLKYEPKQNWITLQATFLYRKREKHRWQARFTRYASTQVSLRSGGQIAFLGPSIQHGRSLLTLRARNKPPRP